jgi:hypothetical protein
MPVRGASRRALPPETGIKAARTRAIEAIAFPLGTNSRYR